MIMPSDPSPVEIEIVMSWYNSLWWSADRGPPVNPRIIVARICRIAKLTPVG
jgi:hypothetical protein